MSKRDRQLTGAICLLLVLGGGMILAALLLQLWDAAAAVRADVAALEPLLAGDPAAFDVERGIALLHTTQSDLEMLDAAARPFTWLAPYLGWVPRYGPDIQAAPALLDTALHLTTAAEAVAAPVALLWYQANAGPSAGGSLMAEAAAILASARPQLLDGRAALEQARAGRAGLEVERLSPTVRSWVAQVDRVLPLLERGIDGALLLPQLLGSDGRRVYLLLVQNEDEVRPTGGFISGVARVGVEGGRLVDLQFEDSYAVDDLTRPYPDPPPGLRASMQADLWLFRDANWSPDFPTSARAAIALYGVSRDGLANGVVALDQEGIRLLVAAIGPLQVVGYAEPVTGENVIQLARQAWAPGGEADAEWWLHRKDFMAALLAAAVRRVEGGLDRTTLVALGSAALRALQREHLIVYLSDAEGADLLAGAGWDGALAAEPGDYVMVVDANVGFNKVNALVEESLEYAVDLGDLAHPRAALVVRHSHPSAAGENPCRQTPRYDPTYEQMMQRCYWDYLRLYVPAGAQLSSATAHPISGAELLSGQDSAGQATVGPVEGGRQVFATLLLLRPGERIETRFEYTLPPGVLQPGAGGGIVYELTVQKQPGTRAIPLRVTVRLPAGVVVSASDPQPPAVGVDWLGYELTLETDWTLRVVFIFGE